MEESLNRKQQRKGKINTAKKAIGLVWAILLGLLLSMGLLPGNTSGYSVLEKRNLSSFPSLTWQNMADGSFGEAVTDWLSDYLLFRNPLLTLRSMLDLNVYGIRESNGITVLSDGSLAQSCSVDEAAFTRTLSALSSFAESNASTSIYVMPVPNAVAIRTEAGQAHLISEDQKGIENRIENQLEAYDNVTIISLFEGFQAVEEKDDAEALYYMTDHHWTTYGAGLAYNAYCQAAGIDDSASEYERITVNTAFRGSLITNSGFLSLKTRDEVQIIETPEALSYVVTIPETQTKLATLYSLEGAQSSDPYTVFFGGNYPLVQIATSAGTGKHLLVLKDSYANCFVPYLLGDYDEIDLVDARYYNDSLTDLMKSEDYDTVLVLYNINTLVQDDSLNLVLSGGGEDE